MGKTPYVRFDLNDYSVPHRFVRCPLTVSAKQDTVSILDGVNLIAQHPRSYDKGKQIEDDAHIKDLAQNKKQARLHRGQDRLAKSIPSCQSFLVEAAARSYPLRSISTQLLQLLDSYGAAELEVAVSEALKRGVPHPNAVRLHLEKRREERQQLPPVYLDLPNDKRIRELTILPHHLNTYDQLQTTLEDENHE